MKIALCISGYMRTFETTFPSLKEYLLSHYPEIHTFIHTWADTDYWTNERLNTQKVENLYHPQKLVVENPFELPVSQIMRDKNPEKLRNINSVLSMFYKIKQCNHLKSQYEIDNNFQYDCVIRFRGDIQLRSQVELTNLDELSIPKFGDFGGLNDQFSFSNSQNMDLYSSLYDHISDYLTNDSGGSLCMKPELLLKYHVDKCNLKLNRPPINYVLLKRVNEELDNEKREREFGYIK